MIFAFPLAAQAADVSANLSAGGDWSHSPVTQTLGPSPLPFAGTAEFVKPGYAASTSMATAASDGAGHFGASVQAVHELRYDPGQTNSSAHLSFVDTIVNSSGVSQAANFGLNIDKLSFTMQSGWMGNNLASFSARVFVNDSSTPIWESSLRLDLSVNYSGGRWTPVIAPTLITGGTSPLSLVSGSPSYLDENRGYAYSFSLAAPYGTELDLGSVDAGDSLSIRYEIDLYAQSYAYGGAVSATFEDPSALNLAGTPMASLSFAQPVPEPETYSMLAAGLGLLAAATRRRQRQSA